MSESIKKEFVFDYTKYKTPGISVETLDFLAKRVFTPDGTDGYTAIIWAAVKLVIALAYIWARAKLVSQQEQIEIQQYQVARTGNNQTEVDSQ